MPYSKVTSTYTTAGVKTLVACYFCTNKQTYSSLPVLVPTHQFLIHSQNGCSPLHEACKKGYGGIVEKLLQAGATVDLQTEVGIAVAVKDGVM